MICSDTGRPNRIRFSIRFSSHKSSTVVRSATCFSCVVEKSAQHLTELRSAIPSFDGGQAGAVTTSATSQCEQLASPGDGRSDGRERAVRVYSTARHQRRRSVKGSPKNSKL